MIRIAPSFALAVLLAGGAPIVLPERALAYAGPPHCVSAPTPTAKTEFTNRRRGLTWQTCDRWPRSWLQSNEPPRLSRRGVCRYIRHFDDPKRVPNDPDFGLAVAGGAKCPPTLDSPGVVWVYPNLSDGRFLKIMALARTRLKNPVIEIVRDRGWLFGVWEEYRVQDAQPDRPWEGERLTLKFLFGRAQPVGPAYRWIA